MGVIDWIEYFNRKERYLLLRQSLGTFDMSEDFRARLSEVIGVPLSPFARMWMDYHFDWIYAAMQLADTYCDPSQPLPVHESPDFRLPGGPSPVHVCANQEDVDLLVADMAEGQVHLVLIEAKAETSWSNSQFASKVNRMRVIFDPAARWRRPDVTPHFVIASPKRPKLKIHPWFPDWVSPDQGRPLWLALDPYTNRMAVERWNETAGEPDSGSLMWHVRPINWEY